MMSDDDIRLLGTVGYELWKSQLIGGGGDATMQRFERMRNPQVGDLVIEISTSGFWIARTQPPSKYPHITAANAVGYLDRIVWEPVSPWDDTDEPAPKEKIYYLRKIDGTGSIFRWVNAQCVAILPIEGWR